MCITTINTIIKLLLLISWLKHLTDICLRLLRYMYWFYLSDENKQNN